MKKNILQVYTDGSSLGNPGIGGWGVIFLGKKKVLELGQKVDNVTNNQMELLAIKKAMEYLFKNNISGYHIIFKSDSKYFIDGIEKWIENWQKNNWKTANKKEVKNQELWKQILRLKESILLDNSIEFEHVKAHNGEVYNERVDDIARGFAESSIIKNDLYSGNANNYLS